MDWLHSLILFSVFCSQPQAQERDGNSRINSAQTNFLNKNQTLMWGKGYFKSILFKFLCCLFPRLPTLLPIIITKGVEELEP